MSITVFQDSIEQIWNKSDSSSIERFIAPNYIGVDPAEPEIISGIEGYRQHFFRLMTAFPDVHITIEHIFGVNDQVAARYTVEATHRGDFGGIPPTGRRVRVAAIAIAKITRGKTSSSTRTPPTSSSAADAIRVQVNERRRRSRALLRRRLVPPAGHERGRSAPYVSIGGSRAAPKRRE